MKTTKIMEAESEPEQGLDTSRLETEYLFSSAANAVRLRSAMAQADASLPPGARILGPVETGSR